MVGPGLTLGLSGCGICARNHDSPRPLAVFLAVPLKLVSLWWECRFPGPSPGRVSQPAVVRSVQMPCAALSSMKHSAAWLAKMFIL